MVVTATAPDKEQNIDAFIRRSEETDLVRLSTAGSVDDGKSTLIGRLLYDSNSVYEDQIASVQKAPVNRSSNAFDLALLTDGLRAEREQGITIDVAYRYFATPKRKFIIADTPGHEQYTRNMATGASTANLAIVLMDARNGVLPQSRRHAFIASMLGIQHIVVAVNKMDLVDYSEDVFTNICAEFAAYAPRLQMPDLHFIPISALKGDNVVTKSPNMPWFQGGSLLHYLETVHIGSDLNLKEMRFPVQYVIRPDLNFRGYAGQIASGVLRPGDPVMVLPSGRTSRVKSIISYDGELSYAFAPMSVVVCLEDEIDIGRGDMLVPVSHSPHVARRIDARVVWMNEAPLEFGRTYLLRHTTQTVKATVDSVRYAINVNTLEKGSASSLKLNDMGAVVIECQKPLFCDPYKRNRMTGSFILIDPMTNSTVAAGMITGREPSRTGVTAIANDGSARNAHRITRMEQQSRSGHWVGTIWLDAPAEVAFQVQRYLFDMGLRVHTVDAQEFGDKVDAVTRALNDAGVIAITYGSESAAESVRNAVGPDCFVRIGTDALAGVANRAERVRQLLHEQGLISFDVQAD